MTAREANTQPRRPIRVRFDEKVDRRGDAECWPWLGAVTGEGYGAFMVASDGGLDDIVGAHRMALFLCSGQWPGEDTRHTCHRRDCVNPAHLLPGSRRQNMADMIEAGRSLTGELQPNAKLSWSRVREARRRHTEGESARQLAAAYGVSVRTMAQCLRGQTWVEPAG